MKLINKARGPWLDLVDIVVRLYENVNELLVSNNIEYLNFDITSPNFETDFNEDLTALLTYMESQDSYEYNKNIFKKIKPQIESIIKKFREEVHEAELLLILAAYRREDGFPLLDMFNKIEIDESKPDCPRLYTVPRDRKEFFRQIVGDGSFLGSFYKVLEYFKILLLFMLF